MNIFQLVGLALIITFLSILIKKFNPEIAIYIPVAAGIIIFLMLSGSIFAIIKLLQDMSYKLNLGNNYLNIILKMIGISFLAEFTADICRDSGETAIANKVEFAGKIMILVLSIPIITALLELLLNLLKTF
jgi:stage III sporulation protein AD